MLKTKQTFSIRETAETLVPDSFGRTNYLTTIIIALLLSLIISVLLPRLPAVVPLFFTLPWGEARLVPRVMLYAFPIGIIALVVINLSLGRVAAKLSPLLPKVLAVSATIISFMLALSLFGIVQSLFL